MKETNQLVDLLMPEFQISNESSTRKTFMKLMAQKSQMSVGLKTALWLPLSIEDKLRLFLKIENIHEVELLILMIFKQYDISNNSHKARVIKQQIEEYSKIDHLVEGTLRNMLYDKYIKLCEYKASRHQLQELKKLITKEATEGMEIEFSFIKLLHRKFADTKDQIIEQKKDIVFTKRSKKLI